MKKNHYLILLLILLVGSFLRLYKLDYQSLWLDELVTMTQVEMPTVTDVINITTKADAYPPGYYIILHFWIKIFGNTEIQLRMISALAGLLSILAIYFLAQQIYGKKEGLLSAALLSVSWLPLYYSQEARAYSLLLFFSILSTLFYWKILQKFYFDNQIKMHNIFIYAISIIFTSFMHYFGLYLVVLQGVAVLIISIARKKYFKELFIIYLPTVILYLFWFPSMVLQFSGEVGQHFFPPGLGQIFYFLKYFFNDNKLVLLIFFMISFILIIKNIRSLNWKLIKFFNQINFQTKFLLIWYFLPIILIFIISNLIKPVFTYRNMIIIYAPMIILFSRLIIFSIVKEIQRIIIVSALLLFLLFNLVVTKKYYSEPTKEQFRETAEYIVSENKNMSNEEILAYTYNPDFFNFYFKKFDSKININHFVHVNFSEEQIRNELAKCNSEFLWFIYAHDEPSKYFNNLILSKYSKVKEKSFIQAKAILFKRIDN